MFHVKIIMLSRLIKNSGVTPFERLKEAENLPESKREEFKIYIKEYIQSDNWKIRNVGVKLIGILKIKEMIPQLIEMLTDRTPDKFINKMLGGDFVQVGFIRRNCIRSLIKLEESDKSISLAIYKALADPYWEVIVEATKTVPKLVSEKDLADIEKRLINLLYDNRFEVVVSSIESLGLISKNTEIFEHFRKLYYHPNQKVRRMLVKAIQNLFDRGVISNKEELKDELNQIFVPVTN